MLRSHGLRGRGARQRHEVMTKRCKIYNDAALIESDSLALQEINLLRTTKVIPPKAHHPFRVDDTMPWYRSPLTWLHQVERGQRKPDLARQPNVAEGSPHIAVRRQRPSRHLPNQAIYGLPKSKPHIILYGIHAFHRFHERSRIGRRSVCLVY